MREFKRAIKTKLISYLPTSYKITTLPRIITQHKVVYVHIPKTGGSSIASVLTELSGNIKRSNVNLRVHEHIKAKEIKQIIGEPVWKDYFTFAFVRNPWDLMISCYHWWLQKADKRVFNKDIIKIKSMGSFTNFINSNYGMNMINECQGNLFDWISENDSIIVNYVGKFENLQKDFNYICYNLGIQPLELPHKNKTKRKNYQEYYNESTKKIIAKRFEKTIEIFKYKY